MEPPVMPDGEVSLAGAGRDRAVSLSEVEQARRASVLAYCARLCDPTRIAEAADAAFAHLREQLEELSSDRVADLDRMLLEATRDAAAARVDVSAGSARLGSRRSTRTCELMPTLLAARVSGRLSASDRAGVERHIARCTDCRELERRRDEADQAFEALLGERVAPDPAAEPFAPGDPEPEVAVGRAEPEFEPADEPEEFDEEPEVEAEFEDEPEADAEFDEAPEAEFEDEPYHFAVAAEPDPPAAEEPQPSSGDTAAFSAAEVREATGSRRPRRTLLIAAMFIAGVLILAIGLFQLAGDDEDGTASQPAERQAAQSAPAAPAPPAEPAPTRAELRTRARLRALGDRELGPGTVGDDVKALQRLLGVQQTGNFGELTSYALTQFQSTHDLPATGIADEATKRKLARRPRPPRQAPAPPAEEQQPGTPGEAPGQTPEQSTPAQPPPATPPAGTPSAGQ